MRKIFVAATVAAMASLVTIMYLVGVLEVFDGGRSDTIATNRKEISAFAVSLNAPTVNTRELNPLVQSLYGVDVPHIMSGALIRSREPRVFTIPGFLTDAECEHFIDQAKLHG